MKKRILFPCLIGSVAAIVTPIVVAVSSCAANNTTPETSIPTPSPNLKPPMLPEPHTPPIYHRYGNINLTNPVIEQMNPKTITDEQIKNTIFSNKNLAFPPNIANSIKNVNDINIVSKDYDTYLGQIKVNVNILNENQLVNINGFLRQFMPYKNEPVNMYQNNFINDIERLANEDNIIFYDVNWMAGLHKFTPIAHLLKILEINPNKQILLTISNHNDPVNKFDFTIFKDKYPNLTVEYYDGYDSIVEANFLYKFWALPNINRYIKKNNLENKKKVLFTSDYGYLRPLYYGISNQSIKYDYSFITDFLPIFQFDEISLIADGTASTDFYDDKVYDYVRKHNWLYALNKDGVHPNAIRFMENFSKMTLDEKANFIAYYLKIYQMSITDVLLLAVMASINNPNQNFLRINYLIPSLDFVKDMNNTSSTQLHNNDIDNFFFNPYLTWNLDLIGLFKTLSDNSINMFYKIFKTQRVNYTDQFDNNNNIVYAGGIINDNEAKTIINIYKENKNVKNLKIWFKGHPGDGTPLQDFKNMIAKLEPTLATEINAKLFELPRKIPFELYLSEPWFNTNTANRTTSIYGSWSTVVPLMYANNMQDHIKKIIVPQSTINSQIHWRFGDAQQSILFNQSKLISLENFQKN